MAVLSFTINPAQAYTGGPGLMLPVTGLDFTKLDEVKFHGLLLELSRMFAISKGVIISSADTVSLTVTIDGTSD